MTTTRVEAIVAGIHTETTVNAGAPGAHTTTTGQNLLQQVSLPLKQIKAEVSPDQMTDVTTAETAAEAVDMTVGNHAVMDIEGKSGGNRTGPHKKTS